MPLTQHRSFNTTLNLGLACQELHIRDIFSDRLFEMINHNISEFMYGYHQQKKKGLRLLQRITK